MTDSATTIHIIKLPFHKDFHFQCFIPFDQGICFIHVKKFIFTVYFNINQFQPGNTLFFFSLSREYVEPITLFIMLFI